MNYFCYYKVCTLLFFAINSFSLRIYIIDKIYLHNNTINRQSSEFIQQHKMVCSFFFIVLPAILLRACYWIWAKFTGKKAEPVAEVVAA